MLESAWFRNTTTYSWAHQDSNLGPRDYESPALTAELWARSHYREAWNPPGLSWPTYLTARLIVVLNARLALHD
jgi:hypothetical protein